MILMMLIFYNIYESYRLSAITDKAGAGVVTSSRFQGGQVVHQARLGILGDSVQIRGGSEHCRQVLPVWPGGLPALIEHETILPRLLQLYQ